MKSSTGPRILTVVAAVTMVVAGLGFVATLMLNAFVFDEYDAYGEVPIPGSSRLELPAGDVTVTFHTVLVGGSGNGLPVPPLKYRMTGPDGVDVQLAEDYGGTTTVNNDARVRVGYLHLSTAGTYDVELDGNVSAYLNPSLAFGHGSSYGHLPWILAAVFGFAVVDLIVARIWAARVRRSDSGAPPWSADDSAPPSIRAVPSPASSEDALRVQTLESLARLRDSGALTQDEYDAEKKRVLEGR
ncbi:SHOCT domain-containing protein [Mycolicibacterium sp. P1-18]|uniref:SHOCT domain-containing protein n=1 Tax=Mycolicibacterium sp. P1-18 TaxID=2024615 RepID=UPI0011F3CF1D|nr:SHOCT domain-containing protein [Mycolicibacterium sp. P1-18]KAA0092020.1 SHOCT domain-containing protein [Mycolicibacterium sp. P1-18]